MSLHQFTIHRIAILVSTHDVDKDRPFRYMFSCVRSTSPDSCVFVARLLCSSFCASWYPIWVLPWVHAMLECTPLRTRQEEHSPGTGLRSTVQSGPGQSGLNRGPGFWAQKTVTNSRPQIDRRCHPLLHTHTESCNMSVFRA